MRNTPKFKFHSVEAALKPDVEEKEEDNSILIYPPLLPITPISPEIHPTKERVLNILLANKQIEK